MRIPRAAKSVLALLVCVMIQESGIFAQQGTQATLQKPSLDLLRNRVGAYWALLARRQKAQATAFVAPSARESFNTRQEPEFSAPKLEKMELADDANSVWVTVLVKRRLPQFPESLDFPVREKWVFRGGKWYVVAENQASIFGMSPAKSATPALTSEEVEVERTVIRRSFVTESSDLEFGTIRQGTAARIKLRYELKGDKPLVLLLRDHPSTLIIHGMDEQVLDPATDSMIEFDLDTNRYDGEVNLSFTVGVRRKQVEVPYSFKIHGFVYAPVSLIPSPLRFAPGETEKELTVRNNTQSKLNIISFSAETEGLRVESLPQSVAPGGECRLKVLVLGGDASVNKWDAILLEFAERVEDMPSIRIPIVRNYNPPRDKKPSGLPKDVEDLLRKTPH